MSQKSINIQKLLNSLSIGCNLAKYSKGKIDKKFVWIDLQTKEICISKQQNELPEELIDIGLIKEIRPGWKGIEDFLVVEQSLCFSIFYGCEFNLNSALISAVSKTDYELWIKGLSNLIIEIKKDPYVTQIERWLQKEFNKIEYNKLVSLKDLKQWFLAINVKITNNKMKELFHDSSKNNFDYESFKNIYMILMKIDSVFTIGNLAKLASKKVFSMDHLKDFFLSQQKDADPLEMSKRFILTIGKPSPENILKMEFVNYLFSKENDIFDPINYYDTQSMDLPMTNYWIASSHNTYLTGHQLKGESSIETYARVLRSGCKCIELDCWDGPNGCPIIYHGYTLTTKINLLDVLRIIKEEAWVKSDYPLILSIENHCTISQQRVMAQAFREIFGKELLTEIIPSRANQMPSPKELKRKIIIKNKKLPGSGESVSDDGSGFDPNKSIKKGIVYIEDIFESKWVAFYFSLKPSKLFFSELTEDNTNELDYNNISVKLEDEPWYHDELIGEHGKIKCEKLLQEFSIFGNGTFLVRHGQTKEDMHRISFWLKDKINHCIINANIINSKQQYSIHNSISFETIQKLIAYYLKNPIMAVDFQHVLTVPVPNHYKEGWYYDKLTREESESKLKKVPKEGAFLMRKKLDTKNEKSVLQYIITFRAEGKIRHSPIKIEDQQFVIGSATFSSLSKIIDYYKRTPLFRKIKLRTAVTSELLNRLPNNRTVRALYDFTGIKPKHLTFPKYAVITNVEKKDENWWKGNYNNVCNYFPSNYVEEIDNDETPKKKKVPTATLR